MTIRNVVVGTHDYTRAFRKRVRPKAIKPNPKGNRAQRRAWDAMRREAELTNRTSDTLKLILSGQSTYAYKDKRP